MIKVTAGDIRAALRARYPAPEYATLFEVIDATGARQSRSADAVIMSCWPSRGLELWGVEIKVARSDWLHERRQPQKAERIAAYCDRWWLVTGPGVVADEAEVPLAWGWMEWSQAGTTPEGKATPARFVVKREAAKTEAVACDRVFLASLLRNAARVGDGLIAAARDGARREAELEVDRRVTEKLAYQAGRAGAVVAEVEAFEAATGIRLASPGSWYGLQGEGAAIGRLVNAIRAAGLQESWNALQSLHDCSLQLAQTLRTHAAGLGIEVRGAEKARARR